MPAGRPSKYDPKKHIPIVTLAAKYGATYEEMAGDCGVDVRTFYRWQAEHSEFCQALKISTEVAVKRAANSTYRSACGYEYEEVKVIKKQVVDREGVEHDLEETHTTTKWFPPDHVLNIFYLCNKDPENWKRKESVEVTHK